MESNQQKENQRKIAKTMQEIHDGFDKKTYSAEEFMNDCRISLLKYLPFNSSKLLYFHDSTDNFPTTETLFEKISEKENVLICIRTLTELFCIFINEKVPKEIPMKKARFSAPVFWRAKGIYMYVLCHKNEMLDEPKRIQYWKGEKQQFLHTFKFTERGALMEFNKIFEIVRVPDACWFYDIIKHRGSSLF